MSLYDEASLVMIPSGYKEDKLYSIKPTSGDGDFTFSRGTDTATRVNASGLIEKERGNLLLQSNSFDTTWLPSSTISATGGQSGYDGSSDAWLLKRSDSAARYLSQNITLGSAVHTYSVYAKAESENWLYIWSYDGSVSVNAYFDLSGSGAVGTTSGLIDANIESVENGWFRCSITYNDNISSVRLYPAVADGSITGGITDAGIYIQDAQLEQGLVATDYIETTTAAVYEGITDNLPRLDYSGGASCPSLLLEPQRTNLFTHSEYFGGWSLGGTPTPTLTANYATSPEGVDNAYRVQLPNLATNSVLFQLISHTTGVDMSISAWVKSASGSNESFKLYGDYGTPTGRSATLTATNEWQRFEFTYTATATGNRGAGLINVQNTAADLLVYGFQIEQASYPTSYIPTYGTSATRAEDSCIKTGISSILNVNEGAVFLEMNTFDNETASKVFTIGDGTANRIQVFYFGDSIRLNFIAGGTTYAYFNHALTDVTDTIKVAASYATNDIRMYVNGVLTNSDTGATMPSTLVYARFDNGSGGAVFNGNIKQAIYFDSALTDAECISLTTL